MLFDMGKFHMLRYSKLSTDVGNFTDGVNSMPCKVGDGFHKSTGV